MLENKDSLKTPISSMGEFALIEHLTKHFDDKAKLNNKEHWR